MSEDMFPREGRMRDGYDPQQVEEFFTRARQAYEADDAEEAMTDQDVRDAAFDQVRGGYRFSAVDAALDRLEIAFVKRRRSDFISAAGQDAWMDHIAEQAKSLYPRLQRPGGEKFAEADGRGYAKKNVDQLMDTLVSYFDDGANMTSRDVRQVAFPPARGKRAYEEKVVDAYLDRVVEVLLAVE